jgi:hypothetical protein
MIVTCTKPGMIEWEEVRTRRNILCDQFNRYCHLNLSVILLTKDEYFEENPLLNRILNRPLVEIYGKSMETPNNKSLG